MDPLTHGLCGAIASRLHPAHRGKAVYVAGMVVASGLPDLDLLPYLVAGPQWGWLHRGTTHSLAGIVATSILLAFAIHLAIRGSRFREMFVSVWLLQASHILLDMLNAPGVPLWLPFDPARTSLASLPDSFLPLKSVLGAIFVFSWLPPLVRPIWVRVRVLLESDDGSQGR